MGQSRPLFRLFLSFSHYNFNKQKLKKAQMVCLVGSRQNHGAMTATSSIVFGPTPASFSFIFGLFKQTIQFLQQINVKKCHVHPVYGAGIQTHNLLNIITRPGIAPAL